MSRQEGYTLLSMMLALSLLMIALFLIGMISMTLADRLSEENGMRKDIRLFFLQTAREIHRSDQLICSKNGHQLTLYQGEDNIDYIPSTSDRVIRQVNFAGFEIVLQRVADIQFICSGKQVSLRVMDKQKHIYQWTESLYLQK